MRVPIGGRAGWAVDRAYLRSPVGGDGGGVEGGVLDVVAHAADVVLAHRLDIEQCTAVVEMELAVPPVVHVIPEVHELRRGADVELQALEDRDDVDALELEGLLHPLGVDRAGAHPLLDGNLEHPRMTERFDAPTHSGSVDQLADQQQLRVPERRAAHGRGSRTYLS